MTKLNPAKSGAQHEHIIAERINNCFDTNSINFQAFAEGGSGHSSDVVIKNNAGTVIDSFEIKTSKGTRIDFGQFRLRFENGCCTQSTGSNNQAQAKIFDVLEQQLNSANFDMRNIPSGPTLDQHEAAQFWSTIDDRSGTSLSGDVLKVNLPKSLVADYYRDKGDSYIVLGESIYSLHEGLEMSLTNSIEECYAVFRIKYHSTNKKTGKKTFSYTVALRAKFYKDKTTSSFEHAIQKIYC